jgi:NAD+ kinase
MINNSPKRGLVVFKRIGIIVRPDCPDADKQAIQVIQKLRDSKHSVTVDEVAAKRLNVQGQARALGKMDVDLVITFGGDGTILYALRHLPKPPPPILPINYGFRGFLIEVEPKEFPAFWKKVENNEFKIHEATQLTCSVNDSYFSDGLNEILITSALPSKILDFEITMGNQLLNRMRGDGVIVATTTGSTAYALSAGGPIVYPYLDVFVTVPIFPMPLKIPSFMTPTHIPIKIKLHMKKRDARVTVDGQHSKIFPAQSTIQVEKSKISARFVRFDRFFIPRLRQKVFY